MPTFELKIKQTPKGLAGCEIHAMLCDGDLMEKVNFYRAEPKMVARIERIFLTDHLAADVVAARRSGEASCGKTFRSDAA